MLRLNVQTLHTHSCVLHETYCCSRRVLDTASLYIGKYTYRVVHVSMNSCVFIVHSFHSIHI